jgi:hypothetical protein
MAETLSGFHLFFIFDPQGCRFRSNPGLKLANAFGVFVPNFKLMHYCCERLGLHDPLVLVD